MKKYTDEHLESVESEFIVAFERTIELLQSGAFELSWNTCPAFICGFGVHYCGIKFPNGNIWCGSNFEYAGDCPCLQFGSKKTIRMGNELIAEWKQWAGIEE